MTRDEIYEHLAKVYLGKRESVDPKKNKKLNSWLVVNIVITVLILASTFYGFTAFLSRRGDDLKNRVMYALNNSPIRISYNVSNPYPPSKTLALSIPTMDFSKYSKLNLSIRGMDEGYPGVVKVLVTNQRNEQGVYFIRNVRGAWQKLSIPFSDLDLTDWSNVNQISFVLEAWNVDAKKGAVLIDDISFSN